MPPGTDAFRQFLDAASQRPLLSASEERSLARRRDAGDEGARHELIMRNVRLAASVARSYDGRGVPLEDLVQEALVGLDRASKKYDPDRGFKFSTYATWWLRQACQRAVAAHRATIRVPAQIAETRAAARALMREDPDMTVADVAIELDLTEDRVRLALGAPEVVTSLDREVPLGDGARTLLDTVPDSSADDPSDVRSSHAGLGPALGALPDLQRRAVELRFGFGGREPLSLAAVAEALGAPQSVAQQALKLALAALRVALAVES